MMICAVIDTNILVSAMLNPRSVPGQIIKEALTGKIIPVLNDAILEEYDEVLKREKFHFADKKVRILLEEICKRAVFVEEDQVGGDFPDPKDIVFYEVLMEQRKTDEAYLVTGNLKHFPEEQYIVSPRELLDIIEKLPGIIIFK